jgi:23S rRNA (cytosine1962-C5)-methyltransferase
MAKIILKKARDEALLRKHPWIFSGAIEKLIGGPQPGETITVVDAQEKPIAVGAYSPQSQIRVRIWSFDPNARIDEAFFLARLQAAFERRQRWISASVNAYRLVNSEADELPGIIVDVYNNYVVLQCLTAGANFQRKAIIAALKKLMPEHNIIERSEGNSLAKEGLTPTTQLIQGELPTENIVIQENTLLFSVDIQKGHKTGFYLDQRDNRQLVHNISANKNVLNCFAYTGGFGIAALAGGATSVTHIESSAKFAEQITQHVKLNGLDETRNKVLVEDVFHQLRLFKEQGQLFDVIILDPPKFADSKQQLMAACRGYQDINRLAMELLTPNGNLLTFSCSGAMTIELFNKIVADAALDAKRTTFVRRRLAQAVDHTVNTTFPDGLYLKGLWCEVA